MAHLLLSSRALFLPPAVAGLVHRRVFASFVLLYPIDLLLHDRWHWKNELRTLEKESYGTRTIQRRTEKRVGYGREIVEVQRRCRVFRCDGWRGESEQFNAVGLVLAGLSRLYNLHEEETVRGENAPVRRTEKTTGYGRVIDEVLRGY